MISTIIERAERPTDLDGQQVRAFCYSDKASDTSILPFRRMVLIRAAVMPAVATYEGTRLSIILSKASSHISGVMNSVAVVPFSSNDVAQTLKHISFSR